MKNILLTTLIITFGMAMYGCKLIVNQMAFYPDKTNVLSEKSLPPDIKEFFVNTEDHIQIQGLYLPLANSNKVLIYFHGNAGNIYDRIPDLIQLQKSGINVIGAGYHGYGKSEGSPSEEGIYRDANATFRYATEELGFSENNVIIFGRSIGTAAALNVSSNRTIRGLILITPLTSGKAQAKASGLGILSPLAGDSFNNLSKIKDIKAPLLVLHGTNDHIIPFSMGKEIFDAAKTEKRFVKIEGAGHNNLQSTFRSAYWPPIIDFINEYLGE